MNAIDKSGMREHVRSLRRNVPSELLRLQSAYLCGRIAQHPRFCRARTLLLYYPLPDEVDIRPLLHEYSRCKTIFLPVIQGEHLVLRQYRDEVHLAEGAFHILEPTGYDLYNPAASGTIDLCVVPGMAFDRLGHRLGRGKGYYDRYFSSLSDSSLTYKLGICFSYQLMPAVPTQEHDIRMDEVMAGE